MAPAGRPETSQPATHAPPAAAGASGGRREAILDAAVTLLGRDGPDGFSAAALAREAGVSKANIFHHFASVDEIAIETFDRLAAGMAMLAPPPDLGFRDWLVGLGEETFALVSTRRALINAWFVFVAKALFSDRLAARLRATLEASRALVVGIVAARHPGRPAPEQADRLAGLILMTLDGLAMHQMLFPDRAEAIRQGWTRFAELVSSEDLP
jgi:AcrR family transcriptional regulator